MRCVSTRVLPEPAPATMSSGPSAWVTASGWTGFSPSSSGSSGGAHAAAQPTGRPLTVRSDGVATSAATSSSCCSTASTATCSAATAAPSSTRRTSTGWRPRSVRFTNHHTGSLPCMPARHDLLVGALDFPWRPWGSIEVWEDADHRTCCGATRASPRCSCPTTRTCSRPAARTTTPTSAPGTTCAATRTTRGAPAPDPSWIGAPALPAQPRAVRERGYDARRTWFRDEADFPGPRTMTRGPLARPRARRRARARRAGPAVVDEFDPHEPFDMPEPWASRYDPDWEGERLIWPPYATEPRAVRPAPSARAVTCGASTAPSSR